MAISLYDTEEVTPVQTIEEVKHEKEKEKPEVVSKVRNAKAPPSMGEAFQTFMGDIGVKPGYDAVSNAPAVVKDYLMNPIQYKEGGEKDYTNIDMGATAPRLAADAAAMYAGAKGVQYGVGQVFPTAGVKQQKDELAFRRDELKRQMEGNLTPQEKAHIALQEAKTKQILASLNPPNQPIGAPSAQAPVAPNAPVTPAPMAPTVQQRAIGSVDPVSAEEKLAAENIKLQSNELTGHVYNKYGVTPTSIDELKMFANQATPEMRASFTPKLIELLNQGVIPKPAIDAGVTPSTSEPEAQTLVDTREASLDPVEKTQEKVTFAEPSKEIKEAVIPKSASKIKEVPEGMGLMEGASGPTNWMYNTHKGRYNAIINEFNNGKHPQTMNEAIALNNQYKNKYGGMNRGPVIPNEIAIERGIPAPEPGGRLGKVVSHAGKFGILASIADIANAAQSNKKGDLLETLYEIGKNLTVPTALGLHTGGLNTNEERELSQRRKIGGGRGVAPAGMGQR